MRSRGPSSTPLARTWLPPASVVVASGPLAPNLQIEPIGRVRCQTALWRNAGVVRLTAIVKATFAFVVEDVARPIEPVAIGLRDRHYEGNPRRSVYESFEVAPYIPGVGVTLVGMAHPPEDHVTPSMSVRLGIYDEETPVLEKTIHVFGERTAEDPQVSRPLGPMPLVYERAVGGRTNLAGSALYNLVSPGDLAKPACFAPVPLAWRALGGRGLDPQTMKTSPIEIPDGFDFSFFNPAPADQRLGSLTGDEWIVLDGMSARAPRLQTRLPGAKARALFRSLVGKSWSEPTELPLPLDTVVIDAEDETISLLFRGHLGVDERASAVHVLAGIDLPEAPLSWPSGASGNASRAGVVEPPRFGAPPMKAAVAATATADPATPAPASRPPIEDDDGGLFGTVVGTIDEILASMPALPFEAAAPGSRREPSSIDPAANTIPATPWDRGAAPGAPKILLPPLDTDETMDPTAVRRALSTSFEDMGTVVGGDELYDAQALPFQPASDAEPARPPPLGLPKVLPFEDRADPEPASRPASMPLTRTPPTSAPLTSTPLTSTPLPSLPATSAPTLVSPPARVGATPVASVPALVGAPPLVTAPTLASVTLSGRDADGGELPPRAPRSKAITLTSGQLRDAAKAAQAALGDAAALAATAPAPSLAAAEEATPPAPSAAPVTTASEAASPVLLVEADTSEEPSHAGPADEPPSAPEAEAPPSAARDSLIGPPDAAARLRREVQARLAKDEPLADLSLVGVNLTGLDLSHKNLSGLDLSGANLTRAVLKGARLSRAKLEGATLSFASLEEADLEGADLRRAVLEGARLSGAKLSGADLTLVVASKASFEGARGRGVRLVEAKLDAADFSRADLVEADFSMAQAARARFEGARLQDGTFQDLSAEGSNFDRADLSRGKLDRAILRRSYFLGTTAADATFENADLSTARAARCVLDRANLEHASFDGADLTGASLLKVVAKGLTAVGARLDGAKLDEGDLRLSKVSDAKLVGASLTQVQAGRADLSKADLSKADLSQASFRNAKLTEAKLAGATLDRADFRDAHLARADLSGCDRESARFAGANLDGVEG